MLKPPTCLVLPLRNSPSLAASRLTSDCHPVDPSMFHGIISFIDDRYIYTETYTHLYRLIFIYIGIYICMYIYIYTYCHGIFPYVSLYDCTVLSWPFFPGEHLWCSSHHRWGVFAGVMVGPFCGAFLGCVLRFTPIEDLAILVFAI